MVCCTAHKNSEKRKEKKRNTSDVAGGWFSGCTVQGHQLAHIVREHLRKSKSLTALAIENCGVNSDMVKEAVQDLDSNTTLQSLSFAHNDIGNIGAKFIGQVLEKNTTLTSLSLACEPPQCTTECHWDKLLSNKPQINQTTR